MPPTFDPAYVQGAVKPFFLSAISQGEPPLLPMIDLTFSKEAALPAHIFGMLYDNWKPNMEEEGEVDPFSWSAQLWKLSIPRKRVNLRGAAYATHMVAARV